MLYANQPALRGLLGYGQVRGGYMGSAGGWHLSTVKALDGEEFACTIDLFNCNRIGFRIRTIHSIR